MCFILPNAIDCKQTADKDCSLPSKALVILAFTQKYVISKLMKILILSYDFFKFLPQ